MGRYNMSNKEIGAGEGGSKPYRCSIKVLNFNVNNSLAKIMAG